jgi:rhodanese-related sulfurtransferase
LRKWVESGQPLASGVSRHEPLGFEAIRRTVSFISPGELDRRLRNFSLLVVDVGPSVDFGQAHVPTAHWISRGWLDLKLPERFPDRARPIVVTCPDGQNSVLAARALTNNGYAKVFVLDGGVGSWVAAHHSTEDGLQSCLVEPNDIVFSPSIRGNKEDMKRYLEWEVKLE